MHYKNVKSLSNMGRLFTFCFLKKLINGELKIAMNLLKTILIIITFCLLTVFTQVGGIIYLLSFSTHKLINKKISNYYLQKSLKITSFILLYCITTFLIVPIIAKPLGRIPLPLTQTNNLQPLNILTCFLNRNYVKPELKLTMFEVAKQMNNKFPGTVLNYLDANFPFFNGFPLFPHLSHNDGKKVDLSFCYINTQTNNSTNESPSFIGYGICEEALPNEKNTSDFCAKNGYWQYTILKNLVSQENKKKLKFDQSKTKDLINFFASKQIIGKIFIEPHLKKRLHLTSDKIRFQGCQAVRHDDHIHIQLK